VDHPLAMDAEAMRRAGYATVDALVARLADPEGAPVLRRAGAADMRTRLGGPPPEQPGDYGAVLTRVLADVLPYAARTDHPGYLAFIPSFTTWPAALAELTAAAANPYCGAWMESAGPAQVELEVIDWFRGWLGLPAGTAGALVNGGSAANLTALLVAREAAGGPSPTPWCTCRTRHTRRWPRPRGRWDCSRTRSGCCRPTTAGAWRGTRWPRPSGPTGARAGSPSPCAPAPARPTPAPSITWPAWPTSVPPNGSGCTSTRPTGASPP